MKEKSKSSSFVAMFAWCVLSITAFSSAALQDRWSAYPWPVKDRFAVMNTVSTLQFYGQMPGFHHGVDFRAPAGTKVYAPVGGKVGHGYYYPPRKVPYTYMVSIDGDDGYRWEFHHIDQSTIPQEILDAATVGGRVERGALLAQIYDAATVDIPPHAHVDVIDKNGVHLNPFQFFARLEDDVPPEIKGIYFVDENNKAVAAAYGPDTVSRITAGRYDLVIDAVDVIPPSMAGDSLYGLEVSVNGSPLGSVRFDRLPHADYLKGVREIYRADSFALPDGTVIANQVETEKPRNFLFHFPLDTSQYPRGSILIDVRASDFAGNSSHAAFPAVIR